MKFNFFPVLITAFCVLSKTKNEKAKLPNSQVRRIFFYLFFSMFYGATKVALEVKNLPVNAGDSIPGLGRSPTGGNGNPLQYSFLENPMDRGTWQAAVHRVTKSQT